MSFDMFGNADRERLARVDSKVELALELARQGVDKAEKNWQQHQEHRVEHATERAIFTEHSQELKQIRTLLSEYIDQQKTVKQQQDEMLRQDAMSTHLRRRAKQVVVGVVAVLSASFALLLQWDQVSATWLQ